MKKILNIILKIGEIVGIIYLWTTAIVLLLMALFGGSFSLELNIFK